MTKEELKRLFINTIEEHISALQDDRASLLAEFGPPACEDIDDQMAHWTALRDTVLDA